MSYNTYPQNPFPPNSEDEKGDPYELPIASANELGGVKVGSNLTIDENGVVSAPAPAPNYSTNEQTTGLKWIDGKDIYRKVFVFENVAASTTETKAHGITNIDSIIRLSGVCQLSDRWGILPYIDDISTYQRSLFVNSVNIVLSGFSNSLAVTKAYAILEYTKSESEE